MFSDVFDAIREKYKILHVGFLFFLILLHNNQQAYYGRTDIGTVETRR